MKISLSQLKFPELCLFAFPQDVNDMSLMFN